MIPKFLCSRAEFNTSIWYLSRTFTKGMWSGRAQVFLVLESKLPKFFLLPFVRQEIMSHFSISPLSFASVNRPKNPWQAMKYQIGRQKRTWKWAKDLRWRTAKNLSVSWLPSLGQTIFILSWLGWHVLWVCRYIIPQIWFFFLILLLPPNKSD